MRSGRLYANSPITEAIIDLRVNPLSRITIADLEKVQDGHETDYPGRQDRSFISGQMEVGRKVSASATSERIGYVFKSKDHKQIFQARLDGFTMSRLAPYDCWETFRNEARKLWNTYRTIALPERILRVAVRYINRIEIPLPIRDFKDYLRTVPEVSLDLPQGLAGYFLRLEIPMDDVNCVCLLNEAIIEPTSPESVSVALDIDVFRTENVPSSEEEIWDFIEALRTQKNKIFEACITDKARELFE